MQPQLGTTLACGLIGRSRATHYRHLTPNRPVVRAPRPTPASALSSTERQAVLDLLNRPDYVNLAPAQVWARELDAGRYWCSESTMYRILRDAGQTGERRRQATHPPKVKPELMADAPSQVWSWDITKLRGPDKGIWYHLYVILDIYSRYVVGWTVASAEDSRLAAELIASAIDRNGLVPHTVHADRGTSMTSKPVAGLLADLGVLRSHSRPRVSNDNPYSEAQFKTIKYTWDYPDRFTGLADAREWCEAFFAYYNHDHRHSGLGLHTPASVHFGTADLVRQHRAVTLAEAYARHPERFGQRPRPPKLPATAWINEPQAETDTVEQTA
ncbi:IS3 family transposase [Solihabitans fulvus]|uniref:IS3 family transposase n=1 Tax=Solihabitans fulvus TaxID=1892852 RepID=A0A5B2WE39_9PSEU|nr:IS3 family transposase [Solihabitans fulvus]KAA2248900.1 IS3 family transposase [Solihabitans fulvus]